MTRLEVQRAHRQRKAAMGICVYCTLHARPDRKSCERHAEAIRAGAAKRRANGLCYECNEPASPGRTRCTKHRATNMTSVKRWTQSEKGREYKRTTAARWRRKDRRGNGRFRYVAMRARGKGIEWSLTREEYDALIAKVCAYCQLPSDVQAGVGLDRLDNERGYVPGNVVPCCTFCNVARGDRLTPEEMRIVGRAIREVRLVRLAVAA